MLVKGATDVQGRTECVLQALLVGVDMFIHEEENNSCHLCLSAYMGGGISEVHSSQFVHVKGLEIYIILWQKTPASKSTFSINFAAMRLHNTMAQYI